MEVLYKFSLPLITHLNMLHRTNGSVKLDKVKVQYGMCHFGKTGNQTNPLIFVTTRAQTTASEPDANNNAV